MSEILGKKIKNFKNEGGEEYLTRELYTQVSASFIHSELVYRNRSCFHDPPSPAVSQAFRDHFKRYILSTNVQG